MADAWGSPLHRSLHAHAVLAERRRKGLRHEDIEAALVTAFELMEEEESLACAVLEDALKHRSSAPSPEDPSFWEDQRRAFQPLLAYRTWRAHQGRRLVWEFLTQGES